MARSGEDFRAHLAAESDQTGVSLCNSIHSLDHDWRNYFVPAIRKEGLQFVRHFDPTDTTLRRSTWYGYMRGLHPWHEPFVPRVLKTIVSSGRLALGRKWESYRLERKYAKIRPGSEDQYFAPLSFNASDVHVQFAILIVLLAMATLVFGVECVAHFSY